MQPVEVPNYTSLYVFVSIALAVASIICAVTKTGTDSKFMRLLWMIDLTGRKKSKSSTRRNDQFERLVKTMYQDQDNSLYNNVPRCCGYDNTIWNCICGKPNGDCETYTKMLEASDRNSAPSHPVPNRRAAIAHARAQDD